MSQRHNGKNVIPGIAPLVLIGFSSMLQVTRTGIKSRTSSNFSEIRVFALKLLALERHFFPIYEGVEINNQPIPFTMDRDGHDFHALFQYMIYTWVQNYTRIKSFFNKILNVKHV